MKGTRKRSAFLEDLDLEVKSQSSVFSKCTLEPTILLENQFGES
jgi:hypothetical protein